MNKNGWWLTRSLGMLMVLLWMSLTFVSASGSDPFDVRITHLTSRDGLPSNQVLMPAEDRYGRIWLSTQQGVCYYNGKKICHPSTDMSLTRNSKKILFDSLGRLWFSGVGLIGRYDGRTIDTFDFRKQLPEKLWPQVVEFNLLYDTSIYLIQEGWHLTPDGFRSLKEMYPEAPELEDTYYHFNPLRNTHLVYDYHNRSPRIFDGDWKKDTTQVPETESDRHWTAYSLNRLVKIGEHPFNTLSSFPEETGILKGYDLVSDKIIPLIRLENGHPVPLGPSAPVLFLLKKADHGGTFFFIKSEGQYHSFWTGPSSIRLTLVASDGDIYVPSDRGVHILHTSGKLNALLRSRQQPAAPRILIREVMGQAVSFSDHTDHLVHANVRELILLTEITGERTDTKVAEYRVGRSPWKIYDDAQPLVVSNLQHGENRIFFRARIPGADTGYGPESVLSAHIDLPFWQRAGVQWSVILLAMGLIGVTGWTTMDRERTRRQLVEVRERLQWTRLMTVQSQLNPHFLFNAMISLQNTIQNKPAAEAREQLMKLSGLIRDVMSVGHVSSSIKNARSVMIPLSRELKLLQDYVELENRQHSPPFSFELTVSPDLLKNDPLVPPLMIQPFVENAIIHGISNVKNGQVKVNITEQNGYIKYFVLDNGIGRTTAEALKKQRVAHFRSYGGEILRQRIEMSKSLGYAADLQIKDRDGGGTEVQIIIPGKL